MSCANLDPNAARGVQPHLGMLTYLSVSVINAVLKSKLSDSL